MKKGYFGKYGGSFVTKEIQEEFMSSLREADSETFPVGYKHLLERASGIPCGTKEI